MLLLYDTVSSAVAVSVFASAAIGLPSASTGVVTVVVTVVFVTLVGTHVKVVLLAGLMTTRGDATPP